MGTKIIVECDWCNSKITMIEESEQIGLEEEGWVFLDNEQIACPKCSDR